MEKAQVPYQKGIGESISEGNLSSVLSRSQKLVQSIQWLRGLAALAVVTGHAASTAVKYHIKLPGLFSGFGAWGVDLFFVISGFIMIFITAGHSGSFNETIRFWLKRIFRIVPLYWLVTTFVVLLAVLMPGTTEYKATFLHVLASYFFIPWQDSLGIPAPP